LIVIPAIYVWVPSRVTVEAPVPPAVAKS